MDIFFEVDISHFKKWKSNSIRDPETGVYYTDTEKTGLELIPGSIIDFFVPKSVEFIVGGSEATSAFRECKGNLKTLKFEGGSRLSKIEKFGCCSLSLDSLDLSNCTLLEIIGGYAFRLCKFSSLILPPNLREIEIGAFAYCSQLGIVEFPDSLTTIRGYSTLGTPFRDCTKLEVIIHETSNLTRVEDTAFYGSYLPEIYIPKKLTFIGNKAYGSTKANSIRIHSENTKYSTPDGKSIFSNNGKTLEYLVNGIQGNYTIPNGTQVIASGALACVQISHLFLPSTLTSIAQQAFTSSAIISIEIPSSVTSIAAEAFVSCLKLTSINLPNLTVLETSLFRSCTKLTEVIIPSGVTTIKSQVFSGCTSLIYVFVPKTVSSIQSGSFSNVNPSIKIEFEEGSKYSIKNEILFNANGTDLIQYIGSADSFEYAVPVEVEVIMASAFESKGLTAIDLSNAVHLTSIEDRAFYATKLQSFVVPNDVNFIGNSVFENIITLTEFIFGGESKISKIHKTCFRGCSNLQSFSIPDSVNEIMELAFASCTNLKIFSIGSGSALKIIHEGAFKSSGLSSITLTANVEQIGDGCFQGSSIGYVVFMTTKLESIPSYAFAECPNLASVELSNGVKSIENSAFEGCNKLTTVVIGQTVQSIAVFAFRNCASLEFVSFSTLSELTSIVGTAFIGCPKLVKLAVPENNNRFISEDGILYDKEQTEIILCLPSRSNPVYIAPTSVENVNPEAFVECTLLQNFSVAEASILKSIGFKAFAGCTSLSLVEIPDTVTEIGQQAFEGCTGFTCGSFLFPAALKDKLESINVPSFALEPCPTAAFTALLGSNKMITELLLQLCSDYDE